MTNGKYVSVETIIAAAYRDLGLSDQMNFEDAVEWIGEAVELIGSPFQLNEKVEYVAIDNYRGKLPCDLHYLTSANGFSGQVKDSNCLANEHYLPMNYSTDTFHHRYCKNVKYSHGCNLTYKVNDDYIFPNFEQGAISLSYLAIPTDERGFPKVPEDIKFRRAATDYLKWKLGFIEWSRGKMPQAVYNALEVEKLHSMGAAQTRGQMPNLDMMESIKNNFIRLIPKINHHADNFASANVAEQRTIHNVKGIHPTSSNTKDGGTFFHNS